MDEQLKTIALEGAERALPRILGLLEKLCALDSCSGHFPAASRPHSIGLG